MCNMFWGPDIARSISAGTRQVGALSAAQIEVPVRPPNLFIGGLAAGAVLELLLPLGPGLGGGNLKAIFIGLGLAAIGIAIAWKAVVQFTDAGTTIPLDEPTDTLVTDGIYGWSRNPIYIGLSVCYVGLAIALTSPWALIALPVIIAVLQKTVIEKEEALLEKEFGENYRSYKKRVPRWL